MEPKKKKLPYSRDYIVALASALEQAQDEDTSPAWRNLCRLVLNNMLPVEEGKEDRLELLGSVLNFVDMMGQLSIPALWARRQQIPSRSVIQEHIDEYAHFIETTTDPPIPNTKKHFEKLRQLLSRWEPARKAPRELVLAARVFFESWELGPPDGWNSFAEFDEPIKRATGDLWGMFIQRSNPVTLKN